MDTGGSVSNRVMTRQPSTPPVKILSFLITAHQMWLLWTDASSFRGGGSSNWAEKKVVDVLAETSSGSLSFLDRLNLVRKESEEEGDVTNWEEIGVVEVEVEEKSEEGDETTADDDDPGIGLDSMMTDLLWYWVDE